MAYARSANIGAGSVFNKCEESRLVSVVRSDLAQTRRAGQSPRPEEYSADSAERGV